MKSIAVFSAVIVCALAQQDPTIVTTKSGECDIGYVNLNLFLCGYSLDYCVGFDEKLSDTEGLGAKIKAMFCKVMTGPMNGVVKVALQNADPYFKKYTCPQIQSVMDDQVQERWP